MHNVFFDVDILTKYVNDETQILVCTVILRKTIDMVKYTEIIT